MIDLRRLRVLRAVAHYGTVTAAAEALHMTTSAASQQIRLLAGELGVPLLEPRGRGVRLTPAAHDLLTHADDITARWEQAEIQIRGLGTEPAGLLRVACFPVVMSRLLAPMAARLSADHPRLDVRLTETEPGPALDLLFQGEVELAVIEAAPGVPPPTDTRFDQTPLLDDVLDLVVPHGHPLADLTEVPLAQAADQTWVLPPPDTTCHAHAMSACGAAGFTPHGPHRAREWSAVAALVAHGLGVALIPRLADLPALPITRVPLKGKPSPARKILTCTRRGSRTHPAVTAALTLLTGLAADLAHPRP
ncbi:LysR family transcriptional regulator [Nocardiopsis changdeensis]|uniref:LysR family transcriptional regulator n=1 Tax=Nocardiopsis changdeensis TaxID=2831969 RepID=A0ABX8BU93_9ACTN|nr:MULTISPECIES: LysR family transcriptional regulator [Nocardiopsis]QUX25646.1 LysR family transcriptional regulator [Nocardiopsis changdeensis]QYX36033.1 LysR family transcriptional regulator [Nocardiopsis sp. MT53]